MKLGVEFIQISPPPFIFSLIPLHSFFSVCHFLLSPLPLLISSSLSPIFLSPHVLPTHFSFFILFSLLPLSPPSHLSISPFLLTLYGGETFLEDETWEREGGKLGIGTPGRGGRRRKRGKYENEKRNSGQRFGSDLNFEHPEKHKELIRNTTFSHPFFQLHLYCRTFLSLLLTPSSPPPP